jgi:uncharacterized membrane protein
MVRSRILDAERVTDIGSRIAVMLLCCAVLGVLVEARSVVAVVEAVDPASTGAVDGVAASIMTVRVEVEVRPDWSVAT